MDTKSRVAIRAIVGAALSWLLLAGAVQAGMAVPRYELVSGISDDSDLDYSALPDSLVPLSPEYIAQVLGLGILPGDGTVVATGAGSGSTLAAPAIGTTTVAASGGERTVVEHDATNDDFSDAYPISSVPFTARTNNSGAGRESGEPADCAPAGGTLWYRFAVARPVGLVASTASNRPASVAIYSGANLRTLNQIDCDTDVTGRASVAFPAEEDTSYYVQVTGPGGGGPIVFSLDPLGATERVSVAHDGGDGESESIAPMLSGNGRYVTFMSTAENLVRGDDDGKFEWDVFVHDRVTGRTELVSVSSKEKQGNGHSGALQSPISADGRYVAFFSEATNLVPRDNNQYSDVFVRDRVMGTTTRVSVSSSGREIKGCGPDCDPLGAVLNRTGNYTRGISITPDGRFVAFEFVMGLDERYPPESAAERTGALYGVYVHDRRTRATELVSVNNRGERAGSDSQVGSQVITDFPMISADGRHVAFRSDADNLICRRGTCSGWDNNNGDLDVFVHDRRTHKTELVTVDSDGNQQNGASLVPAISANGRYVVFASSADNLVTNSAIASTGISVYDVFVHDRKTGKTEMVSVNSAGEPQDEGGANGLENGTHDQLQPAISPDGRYVVFSSTATNLAANDENGAVRDVFLHDRVTGVTTLVSVSSAGRPGEYSSGLPALSADARFVAFTSGSELVPEDGANLYNDVFVHSLPFL